MSYPVGTVKKPLSHRFWEKVDKKSDGECWEWLGYKNNRGYGSIFLPIAMRTGSAKCDQAHRVSYILAFGSIPQGMCVRHKCDNPGCVNPAHLELGTHAENMKDRTIRNRVPSGDKHARSKLTTRDVEQIRTIRKDQGLSMQKIARLFNVGYTSVRNILVGRSWKGAL